MTELHRVLRDGKNLTEPMSHDDCWKWLHKHQGMSVDWALEHEGYSIKKEVSECEKLNQVSDENNIIHEFLEWLGSKGMFIARYEEVEEYSEARLLPVTGLQSDMVHDFLGIDPVKLEKERRELLESLQ